VVTAAKPPQPIDKGLPGPGLLAHVVTGKYADHLPLHRQEAMLARQGVELSRSTLCDWMAGAANLLTPLYTWMLSQVLRSRGSQGRTRPSPAGCGCTWATATTRSPCTTTGQTRPATGRRPS